MIFSDTTIQECICNQTTIAECREHDVRKKLSSYVTQILIGAYITGNQTETTAYEATEPPIPHRSRKQRRAVASIKRRAGKNEDWDYWIMRHNALHWSHCWFKYYWGFPKVVGKQFNRPNSKSYISRYSPINRGAMKDHRINKRKRYLHQRL